MNLTKDQAEILHECSKSTRTFCKVFFPDRFKLPFSPSHDKAFELLDSDEKLIAISAWRGFGKSSIVQLGLPAKGLLFREHQFIIPASCTATLAETHSENLKRELLYNPRVSQLGFKGLKSDVWAKDCWITNTPIDGKVGTMVMPRGYGQQVRGLLFQNTRPSLIVLDDLEDRETVMSEEQRAKKLEWVYTDVMGAIDKSSNDWRIIYIGTILHQDSLLSRLLDNPSWSSINLELCDDDYNSNWPEQISSEGIKSLLSWHRNEGLLDLFYMEYRGQCVAKEDAPFRQEDFCYFEPKDLKNKFIEYVVLVDPGKSTGGRACDSAIMGLGISALENRVYIVDGERGVWHPDETQDRSFRMCARLGARVLGVEKTGSGEWITWPYMNEIRRQGLNLEFIALSARKGPSQYVPKGSADFGKDSRIGHALVGMYRRHQIYHDRLHPITPVVEEQLLYFPRSKKKDVIDALAYVAGIMDAGERYFSVRFPGRESDGIGFLDTGFEDARLRELTMSDLPQPELQYPV